MSRLSRILGIGSYVPARVWTNNDLTQLMDTSDDWIRQRTGIEERHWVEQDTETTTSDLGLEAAKHALEAAGVKKEELDLIIFATLSPDHEFPGTACFLQRKLGVPGIGALDIRQQCSGFLYGLSIADNFIRGGQAKKVLLVGAEVHSKGMDKTTRGRDLAVLFGDGAGAAVIGAVEGEKGGNFPHILSTHLHADGKYAEELWTPGPGFAYPKERISHEMLEKGLQFPQMNGKTVFMHATKRMAEVLMEALNANGLKIDDIDMFFFHQANMRINEMVAKQLGIPAEKVYNTIQKYGNTTAATIPLGMDDAIKAGKLKPGMLLASAAFGSGFTWASSVFRF